MWRSVVFDLQHLSKTQSAAASSHSYTSICKLILVSALTYESIHTTVFLNLLSEHSWSFTTYTRKRNFTKKILTLGWQWASLEEPLPGTYMFLFVPSWGPIGSWWLLGVEMFIFFGGVTPTLSAPVGGPTLVCRWAALILKKKIWRDWKEWLSS